MVEFEFLKIAAQVFAHQLEVAGFNVDLQLGDQGLFIAKYLDPNMWHFGVTISSVVPTPTMLAWTREEHIGWWTGETPRKLELGELLRTETDHAKRYEIWEELQLLSYQEASRIRFGTHNAISASTNKVTGWMQMPYQKFWNAWIIED